MIGNRQTGEIGHFSPIKRFLQAFGSRMISRLARLEVPDVASGFRAFSREAALHMTTFTGFDHTAEHVVEAGHDKRAVINEPIRPNPKARESRLFSNIGEFVIKSGSISLRTYARYKALKIFAWCGAFSFILGFLIGLRFCYYYFIIGAADEYIQSLILAAILLLAGFQMFLTGIVADLIATNRVMLEDALVRVKKIELSHGDD